MVITVDGSWESTLRELGFITPSQSFDFRRDIPLVHKASSGKPTGFLCLRPMFYAHSFRVPSHSRFIANQLFDFASDLGQMASVHGCLFQIEEGNSSMRSYVEARGAVAEPGSVLYRLDRIPLDTTSRR